MASLLKRLRPRQNGRHFPDNFFQCISLNENIWIAIEISLKFVPKGPVNNIPVLVRIMAWRWQGDKPLSEPMMNIVYWYASLGLNELTFDICVCLFYARCLIFILAFNVLNLPSYNLWVHMIIIMPKYTQNIIWFRTFRGIIWYGE